MRSLAAMLLAIFACAASPLEAQQIAYEALVPGSSPMAGASGNERFVAAHERAVPSIATREEIAAYGPFRVLDGHRAALVDATDQRSPAAFTAMLAAYPGIELIEMIDCPGTEDDIANLKLGRMIRARGISTWVPEGGSVRSGGVELFLAGARRFAHPQAEFAVHAWEDEDGRQATDYPLTAPENAKYLAYYREMGLSQAQAQAFYAMTNAVRHEETHWFDGAEMARWVVLDEAA